ncbi:MAG: hypothetical protein ABIE36_01550 [Candidatus Diapherotrites archaeon]
MAKQSLEGITYDVESEGDFYNPTSMQTDKGYDGLKHSLLEYFKDNVKGQKRKDKVGKEVDRIFSQYVKDIKKYSPIPRRASMLEQSYNAVPEEEELDGKDAKEVLEKRLYANPGRQYNYLNGIVGEKKKSKDIKGELGKAAGYALKEGWPVLGAGTAWWLANRAYNKGTAKGLAGRLGDSFNKKWWQYLVPGIGPIRAEVGLGKTVAKEGLRAVWGLAKTPFLYAIGAYAAYKTIGYLLKRRKEKKLEHKEVERLEKMRNDMISQRQMIPSLEQQAMEAA